MQTVGGGPTPGIESRTNQRRTEKSNENKTRNSGASVCPKRLVLPSPFELLWAHAPSCNEDNAGLLLSGDVSDLIRKKHTHTPRARASGRPIIITTRLYGTPSRRPSKIRFVHNAYACARARVYQYLQFRLFDDDNGTPAII